MPTRFQSVRISHEHAAIEVSGRRIPAAAYASYIQQPKYLKSFGDAGCDLYSVMCTFGDRGVNSDSKIGPFRPHIWTGPDEYDYAQLDHDVAEVLAAAPDAHLLFRVFLDVPTWWDEMYPEELNRLADGSSMRQSFASEVWRSQASEGLRAFIQHLAESDYADRVVAIMVAGGGTEEWAYHGWTHDRMPDYSRPMQRAFRRWCEERGIGDGNVTIPTPEERKGDPTRLLRDEANDWKAIEYYQCHSQVVAEAIIHFCRVVKEATDHRLLAGAFYGYIFEVPSIEAGHLAGSVLLESDDCDFIAAPNSYMFTRQTGIDWPFFSATDSVKLHRKLWMCECDTRTDLTRPLKETKPEITPAGYYEDGVWKGPDSREDSLRNLRANLARAVATKSGLWWFDMWGGWYESPDFLDFMKRAREAYEAHQGITVGGSVAEVAVFVDEPSTFHTANTPQLAMELMYLQRRDLGLMGTPYDVYYLKDLETGGIPKETLDRYKVVLFLNTFVMGKQARAAVEALKSDGRVLCWFVAPGYFGGDEADHDAAMSSVTGIDLKMRPPADEPLPLMVKVGAEVGSGAGSGPDRAPGAGSSSGLVSGPAPGSAHELLGGIDSGSFGIERPVFRDAVVVTDSDAISLGTITTSQGEDCGFAVKQFDGWTSIFSSAPRWSWEMLQNVCRYGNVHLYADGGEPLYAAEGFVALNVNESGGRVIRLKEPAALTDFLTGEIVSERATEHRLQLSTGTHLWVL